MIPVESFAAAVAPFAAAVADVVKFVATEKLKSPLLNDESSGIRIKSQYGVKTRIRFGFKRGIITRCKQGVADKRVTSIVVDKLGYRKWLVIAEIMLEYLVEDGRGTMRILGKLVTLSTVNRLSSSMQIKA